MNEEEFNKLSRLCRISCTEEEKQVFLKSLDNVLAYIEQLQDVDTEGVEPCYTVHETISNVLREDVPEEPLAREQFLANAPAHTGGMVRVPPVLKG
jgi:aspartyl-tRNA(Asn)/glutamyl-tRNA(Gln) amidotransferase subunit C